jgi:hypothetical protein
VKEFIIPWAKGESISALTIGREARSILEQVGLKIDQWLVKVQVSIEFFQRMTAQIEADGSPPKRISGFVSDSSTDVWKEPFSFFELSSSKQSTVIMRRRLTRMSLIKISFQLFAKISAEKNL